jgi:hypothetical protein
MEGALALEVQRFLVPGRSLEYCSKKELAMNLGKEKGHELSAQRERRAAVVTENQAREGANGNLGTCAGR